MNLLESHDYTRCKELLIEWTSVLREMRKEQIESNKFLLAMREARGTGPINTIFEPKSTFENSENLLMKMEKFSNMVSQQIERNYLDSPKKPKLSLDFIELEIRLAEFESAMDSYRDATSSRY